MGLVAYGMLQLIDPYFSQDATFGVLGHGLISGVVAVLVGTAVLYVMKNEEIQIFINALHKKLWKTSISHHGEI
jgi:uncharacterized membrane-anchored protein